MITHHFPEDILLDYAAGSLPEAQSLMVASHISMCGACLDDVGLLEAVGGSLLDDSAQEDPTAHAFDALLSRIDASDETPALTSGDRFNSETCRIIPPPLRDYLDANLESLAWRFAGPGMREAVLVRDDMTRISLYRIRPGGKVPTHTHRGQEYTLILNGAYKDGDILFGKGDVSIADDTVDHAPVAEDHDYCLCLTLFTGPVRLTGPLGRVLNPLLRS